MSSIRYPAAPIPSAGTSSALHGLARRKECYCKYKYHHPYVVGPVRTGTVWKLSLGWSRNKFNFLLMNGQVSGVEVADYGPLGLGLRACRDVKQGEEVIVVPKEAMITEETARKSYLGE